MKHPVSKNILLSVLAVITMFSLFTLIEEGHNFIGTSYFDSESFTNELSDFESSIVPLVLATPDKEEVKKNITVTADEMEEYRNRYGNLESQLESIQQQYASPTGEVTTVTEETTTTTEPTATETTNEPFITERDKKMEDITKNFTDDSYIEQKIRLEKEAQVDAYYQSIERVKNDFLIENDDINYDFKNVETGERFTNGDIESNNSFSKEYSSNHGYLKERTTYENVEELWNVQELVGNQLAQFEGTVAIPEASILSGNRAYSYNYFITNQRIFYGALIAGILAAIAFVLLWRKNGEKFRYDKAEEKYFTFPIDVRIALFFISIFVAISATKELIGFIFYYKGYDLNIITIIVAVLFTALALYQWKWIRTSIGSADWKQSLMYGWLKSLEGFFLKRSIGVQTLILLIVVFFWGFGTMMFFWQPAVIIVWIPATLLIGIPVLIVLLKRMAYLNRVMVKTEEMAKGVIGNKIEEKGKSPIAEHAASLNQLRDRINRLILNKQKASVLKRS